MSDPNSPHIKSRDTPSWGLYQRENFWKLNEGEVPQFNTRESPRQRRNAQLGSELIRTRPRQT